MEKILIKAGIVGVSGYSGIELFHILSAHPDVKITALSSRTHNGEQLGKIYPHLAFDHNMTCKDYSPEELADICDVVFTAVPHGGPAMDYALPIKKAGKKMIDLSADFRIKDKEVYEKWYQTKHKNSDILNEAIYGLPEIYKEDIKKAWLVANPGCYTTAAILSLIPLLKEGLIDTSTIIIDAKSGVSGAGRKPKKTFHFPEIAESFQAYSIEGHRHIPEIEQELSFISKSPITITFIPHLIPIIRGILSVSYAKLNKKVSKGSLLDIYNQHYHNQPFVRIIGDHLPNTKHVAGTNYIDITASVDERNNRVIIISAIDNLIKGASGQAVQNMNLMFGLKEDTGLKIRPMFP